MVNGESESEDKRDLRPTLPIRQDSSPCVSAAFTLLELLVAVGIAVILITVVTSLYYTTTTTVLEGQRIRVAGTIKAHRR